MKNIKKKKTISIPRKDRVVYTFASNEKSRLKRVVSVHVTAKLLISSNL